MRDPYFDFLKGIAIWLVVFGHCMQSFYPNWSENWVALAIYAFHMPLFMAISGKFFLSSVSKVSCSTFIKKKFVRLYLPSLCWGMINAIILSGGKYMAHHEIDIPYSLNLVFTGMWFLTVLFIFNVIGALIEKWASSKRYIAWLFLFLLLYFSPSFWMRNRLLFLLPFFVGSFELGKYKWKSCPLWLGVISLSLFVIVLFRFYSFDVSLYRMTADVLSEKYHFHSLIRYTLGFTGCISSIFICKYLFILPGLSKIIIGIGKKTLPIYVLHQFILLPNLYIFYSTNNYILIFIFSVLLVFISIIIYSILQKQRYLKLYLFGETK